MQLPRAKCGDAGGWNKKERAVCLSENGSFGQFNLQFTNVASPIKGKSCFDKVIAGMNSHS